MRPTNDNSRPFAVNLIGQVEQPEFQNALALLRKTAVCETVASAAPEVVIVAQSRPGQVSQREIESLQRRWPLAGFVAILGSWCEGELRTGRPWPGVKRFYWYEFPAWWHQQFALRRAGYCPEWLRPTTDAYRTLPSCRLQSENRHPRGGLIHLSTSDRDLADTLADVLHRSGYATVWNPPGRPRTIVRGAVAGIWDGGQLDDREELELASFCRSLARDAAPVVALLDFPRRDRCDAAKHLGAAIVLGKPWMNADLVAIIDEVTNRSGSISNTRERAA